jgi:3',5'-cyclic AMP phosphodiesterase CpdA
MLTLAHLSDPHLGPLPSPALGQLLGKRFFGFLSWTFRRKAIHDGPVLPALTRDLRQTRPDHVAVTGDIVNISLPAEFARAGAWLQGLGQSHEVTVVPGNHDAYVAVPWSDSLGLWAPFMAGRRADGADRPPTRLEDFPFVRERDGIALIGVSTALPMPVRSAAGRIGSDQLAALARELDALGERGLFRVVLLHHPPLGGDLQPRKRLLDATEFAAVVARHGAELILHGHTHRSGLGRLPTPRGHAPVIGVPSASARAHHGRGHARYHLYRVARDADRWRVEVEVRGVRPDLTAFRTEGRFTLDLAA